MSLLDYNEVKERKMIIYENEPYEVLEAHVARTQQRKPQNQVKMRNLISGRAVNATFHSSDTIEEADITKRDVKFLYRNRGEYWFADPEDPKNRFQLAESILSDMTKKFLKDNTTVTSLVFNYDDEEKIIGINLPIKMQFLIKEAPPAIKGNSANSGNKPVTLENGSVISAPLFLEAGETILVNTDTGEYVERV